MATPVKTDWDRLVAAFRDATLLDSYYLNSRTGQILFHNERKLGRKRAAKVEARVFDEPDWLELPFLESDDEYAEMQAFAESAEAEGAGPELLAALGGEKPFRRFREALRQHPTVAEAWEQVRLRSAIVRLVDFCEAFELTIEHPAFEAARAAFGAEDDPDASAFAPAASLALGRRRAAPDAEE